MSRRREPNPYDSPRACAWRNLMISTINAALEAGLVSLDYDEDEEKPSKVRFGFALSNGLRCRGYVDSRGRNGELLFAVSVNPGPDHRLRAYGYLDECDATASGWLERGAGKWLQCPKGKHDHLRCRRAYLSQLAELDVEPKGYADRGNFIP